MYSGWDTGLITSGVCEICPEGLNRIIIIIIFVSHRGARVQWQPLSIWRVEIKFY